MEDVWYTVNRSQVPLLRKMDENEKQEENHHGWQRRKKHGRSGIRRWVPWFAERKVHKRLSGRMAEIQRMQILPRTWWNAVAAWGL